MTKNIEDRQAQRRKEAWQSAWAATLLCLLTALLLLGLRWYHQVAGLGGTLLALLALLDLGSIVPVWILLKTRLREIQGGEEDAAAQY